MKTEGGVVAGSTETLALHLVRSLYDATEGTPQAWRSLAGLGKGSDSEAVVQYAVDRGWLLIEGGHSVCLTDAGRRRAQI
jgi:predicted sugar kinase